MFSHKHTPYYQNDRYGDEEPMNRLKTESYPIHFDQSYSLQIEFNTVKDKDESIVDMDESGMGEQSGNRTNKDKGVWESPVCKVVSKQSRQTLETYDISMPYEEPSAKVSLSDVLPSKETKPKPQIENIFNSRSVLKILKYTCLDPARKSSRLFVVFNAKIKAWIMIQYRFPIAFRSQEDLDLFKSKRTPEGPSETLLEAASEFISKFSSCSKEIQTSLESIMTDNTVCAYFFSKNQDDSESRKSILHNDSAKSPLSGIVIQYVINRKSKCPYNSQHLACFSRSGFHVQPPTFEYKLDAEETIQDLVGMSARTTLSGKMTTESIGSFFIVVDSKSLDFTSSYFVHNNEYRIYSTLHKRMLSTCSSSSIEDTYRDICIYDDNWSSNLIHNLKEIQSVEGSLYNKIEHYFIICTCAYRIVLQCVRAGNALPHANLIPKLVQEDVGKYLSVLLHTLVHHTEQVFMSKLIEVLESKSPLEEWYKVKLEDATMDAYFRTYCEDMSKEMPLRYQLSENFNFDGRMLAVVMMISIAGQGTTGFSQLFSSEIKKMYPNVHCEVQRSEDTKSLMVEAIKKEQPGISQEKALAITLIA